MTVSLNMLLATVASLALAATAVLAGPTGSRDVWSIKRSPAGFPLNEQGEEMHLIETTPDGPPDWLTWEQVVALGREDVPFMDVTFQPDLTERAAETRKQNIRPSKSLMESKYELQFREETQPIVDSLSTTFIQSTLEQLASFYDRFYTTEHGVKSSEFVFNLAKEIAEQAHEGVNITVTQFKHEFDQPSVIARIEGEEGQDATVIVGAHQDSVNWRESGGRAPGADDDGSGSSSIFEAYRGLVAAGFRPKRPVEFQWYAAEEVGLLGSQDIASTYQKEGRHVAGMLQLDMTGTPNATHPDIAITMDFTDPATTKVLWAAAEAYNGGLPVNEHMPRRSNARAAPPRASAPVRSSTPPRAAAPSSQQNSYSSHPPPPRPGATPAGPMPMGTPASSGPGLMSQMAATAGGVAIGSAVGHAVGNMFSGSSGPSEATPYQQAPPVQTAPPSHYGQQQQPPMQLCEVEWRQLVECSQRQNDLSVCQAFQDLFRDCKQRNGI